VRPLVAARRLASSPAGVRTLHPHAQEPAPAAPSAQPGRDCWAAHLRGQADALGLHVLDTARPIDVAMAELAALVEDLAQAAAPEK